MRSPPDSDYRRTDSEPTARPVFHNPDTTSMQPHPHEARPHDSARSKTAHWQSGNSAPPACCSRKSSSPSPDALPFSDPHIQMSAFRQSPPAHAHPLENAQVPSPGSHRCHSCADN